ncbi:hypothetical protein [Plantibacter sp. T3]|uniref:hypothetical protein n=1 Tax=Plantibacter sp. T3 TaxID=2653161 RepID=UPI0012F0F57F|nr:hypothetical protein [Plantibacter sp. T3]VXC39138.1 hypothetical protein PLANTIT3_80096 [Plantibacter sp. T3]
MATDKQELAVQIYVANRGISKAEAMRRAGYADATARNPKNLTGSLSWEELMESYLPDDKLVKTHQQLLDAKRLDTEVFPIGLDEMVIKKLLEEAGCVIRHYELIMTGKNPGIHVWFWAPDQAARRGALDLAYKLKGKMTQKVEHSGTVPVAMVEFLGDDGPASSTNPVS